LRLLALMMERNEVMNRVAFLIPVTRRGFNKLKQHGQTWEIRRTETEGMILLESQGKTFKALDPDKLGGFEMQTDWRWVHRHDDPDFEVEIRERPFVHPLDSVLHEHLAGVTI